MALVGQSTAILLATVIAISCVCIADGTPFEPQSPGELKAVYNMIKDNIETVIHTTLPTIDETTHRPTMELLANLKADWHFALELVNMILSLLDKVKNKIDFIRFQSKLAGRAELLVKLSIVSYTEAKEKTKKGEQTEADKQFSHVLGMIEIIKDFAVNMEKQLKELK